jgi:hypothetical protein
MIYGHTGRPDPIRDYEGWFGSKPEDHHDNCQCIDCTLASMANSVMGGTVSLEILRDPSKTFILSTSKNYETTSAAYLLKQLRDAIALSPNRIGKIRRKA